MGTPCGLSTTPTTTSSSGHVRQCLETQAGQGRCGLSGRGAGSTSQQARMRAQLPQTAVTQGDCAHEMGDQCLPAGAAPTASADARTVPGPQTEGGPQTQTNDDGPPGPPCAKLPDPPCRPG